MKLRYTVIFGLSLFAHAVVGQQTYAPEKLSKAVNTPYAELNPFISPDGNTLYFVRANHPENTYGTHDTQDIWYSQLEEGGNWSKARRMPEHLNKNRYNAILGIFNEGQSLLLLGGYNKGGNIWKKRGFSVSHKTDSGWSLPQPLKIKGLSRQDKGLYSMASISDDGQYLVMAYSKRHNAKRTRLYVSRKKENGSYSKPKRIRDFNDRGIIEAPFLSADGRSLYFTSNLTQNYQIYRAERLSDDGLEWSKPKAVNDSVNSSMWESYFRTNLQGSYAYFVSNRLQSGLDIYGIKLVEERPFVLVKGQVLLKDQTPLNENINITFYANNQPIDSVSYEPASGSYQAWLPLGNKYDISAQAYSHTHEPALIDVRNAVEFTELEQNLYLEPITVVKIEGQLLIRSSNTPVPATVTPLLLINGRQADSLVIDPVNNHYQLWLPYGQDYTVQVQADGYEQENEQLKLSHIDGYQVINKNLFVDTKKMATISGIVYDKKSGKPFSADVPLQIILNDSIEANILIDGESRNFSLKLPLGQLYSINAKAEGYYPMFETVDLRSETQNVKVLKDLYLAPLEVGQSIRLNNIFFETGKSVLNPNSYPELDRVVTFLQENPKMKVEIAGHTDNVGKDAANQKLSAERAKAVAAYIIAKGVDDDRISSKGYGSRKPEADNATEEGRGLNRRVEFTILEIIK